MTAISRGRAITYINNRLTFLDTQHFLNPLAWNKLYSNQSIITYLQKRWMTRSRRVQDRSKNKRVHDLEIVTERWKVASKVIFLMEVLKKEPEQVIPLRKMEQYRQQISLNKPHKVSDFISKSPRLFEMYRDKKGVLWCGLSKQASKLMEEESHLLEQHQEKAAEHVTKFLMMSVNRRLRLDKIVHFRRDLGLPEDFREKWIHMFPEYFKPVKMEGIEHLELVSWNPAWAVTELEKRTSNEIEPEPSPPGTLSLPFPLKFPSNFKKIFRLGGKLEHFQRRSYLSPYADATELVPGSHEFDKRAIAVMHELLSFTIEKRLVTDHLTHFRREFVMPQKLMRLLLKHFGIFYVSERGKRFHVFLTEAYEGSELIEKCPLAVWKEKVVSLTGYRGKKREIKNYDEFSDIEECDHNDDFEEEIDLPRSDFELRMNGASIVDNDDEMDVMDIYDANKDPEGE